MQNEQAFPIKIEKAGIAVNVEMGDSGAVPQFVVVYSKKAKKQKEAFDDAEKARQRADAVLAELVDETFPMDLEVSGVTGKVYYTPTSNGYDAFTLTFYQDGKRKREQFGSLEDACKRGKQALEALSKGQIEAASMTLQDSVAYQHALRYLEGTGVSLESACKDFATAFHIVGGVSLVQVARDYARRHNGTVTNRMVRQVVDEFLAAKREGRATRLRGNGRKVSEKYLYELERKLSLFAEHFNLPIGMVSSTEINNYIGELDVEGRTKNNYIQAVNVLFEFAKKQKYLPRDHDVLDEVESVAEADFVIDIFTPEELAKLLKHANPQLVPVLALGAFAGLRTAEIERLEWQEVNLKKKFIEVTAQKAKTRARRLVPITDNLGKWLKPFAQEAGNVWPHSAPYLFELQREAGKAAGVPWKHNALRHSFISYRLAMVKSVDQVAMEAGNSAQVIFQHYRELVTEAAAKKWFGIVPKAGANVVPMVKGREGKAETVKTEGGLVEDGKFAR